MTTPVGAGTDEAYGLVIQPNGKIVLGGRSDNGANEDFALVRYNEDGSLDAGFGGASTLGGTVSFNEGGAAVVFDGDVTVSIPS